MNVRTLQSSKNDINSPLTDGRTLSVLISRIRIFASTGKDKKIVKKHKELIASLEKLLRMDEFTRNSEPQLESGAGSPFVEGVPRSVLQVDGQFSHYVNPRGDFQAEWSLRRRALWHTFEASIPENVRDLLMSWRWRAELSAFEQIQKELESSQQKVCLIQERLTKEEKRAESASTRVSLLDRLRIIRWSKSAQRDEAQIEQMELLKQKKNAEIVERLRECERLSALIALENKTLLVDCGEHFATVFEDFTRAVDNEIKKELAGRFTQTAAHNEVLKKSLEHDAREKDLNVHQLSGKIHNRTDHCEGDWVRRLNQAQQEIQNEFLCLNAFEIEQQEDAHRRWKSAVESMRSMMKTAEESLLYGEHGH
jgi:uncharacterized surface protein with fasciclin (FAS1) repeats